MTNNTLQMNETQLCEVFSRHWWVLLLRGIAAITFGVLSYLQPGLTITTLVIFFGAYCLVDGILGLWTAYETYNKHKAWWSLVLGSVLSIGIAAMTFLWPGVTAFSLVMVIAFWSIFTGISQIVTAVNLRKEIDNEWLLGLAGAASVVFGFLLTIQPQGGALALVWMIATYAVIVGILMIMLAFKCKSLPDGKMSV